MNIILSGGGTGGHIFPAIAIADELRNMQKDINILFVGAKGKLEEKIVPENNYEIKTINISGFNKNIKTILTLPFKILSALSESRKILKSFKPGAVAGTGGYASGPIVQEACKMKIPTLIQEGNAIPGKVTKFLSGKVNKVVVNFPGTADYLKRKDNIIQIAHPIRSNLSLKDKKTSLESYNLNPERKTLFIFGGSQGAHGINKVIFENLNEFRQRNLNIIWQTGRPDFENYKSLSNKDNISVHSFINDMDTAYSASDLIICRAGITSIMEIAALGKPAVFVPYPFSAENHQLLNARTLEKSNAGFVVLHESIRSELLDVLFKLITDDEKLKMTGENIKKFSDISASKKIAEEILKIAV
jgi:UDP-N-acetylglucosamine--N-acetylmuramyl-(pentapeptide) pyrophosphoryl-undecaprenol N-acetylglucosamine transferase